MMKKYIWSMIVALAAIACADEDYNSAFREFAGIKSVGLASSITEDQGEISIPVLYGGNLNNAAPFNVNYEITGGTYGEDYTVEGGSSSTGTVSIAPGKTGTEAVGHIVINGVQDFDTEENVTLNVKLTSADGNVQVGYPYKNSYTFTIADDDCPFDFVGPLDGVDGNLDGGGFEGAADATIAFDGTTYTIDGLNSDFILNFWGEEVQTSVPVIMQIAPGGAITIDDQYIFTTLYDGDLYDYHISGTGQVNYCDGTITLDYEMNQDGFEVGAWLHDNGYMTDPIFKAVLTPVGE
jgi:hypothetical protein